MTNDETWQHLLSLESRDAVSRWFNKLHSRELNARRAKEITAAAKQGREYFRNAKESAYSVKPLLTFYGVTCLSRSLLLLLKPSGGEESLTAGHGLETVAWAGNMSGESGEALRSIPKLRIRTTSGLFTDFIKQTDNRATIHVSSSAVDWSICYDIPPLGTEITFNELCARTPDLKSDYESAGGSPLYSVASDVSYNHATGFRARLSESNPPAELVSYFLSSGYTGVANAGTETFKKHLPLFVQTYAKKMFGSIPTLHLAPPFKDGALYSQLGTTYMISYILGMLVRYYPTHWISLIQGDKGDTWWPTINQAQHLVEKSYPELIIELIHYLLKNSDTPTSQ